MALESVAAHYRRAGWTVHERPQVGDDAPFFRPDLLLERKGHTRAVLLREEPASAFELGKFAAQCKRHGLPGLVVCEVDSGVERACELHGLELLNVQEFYAAPRAPTVVLSAPPNLPVSPSPLPPSAATVSRAAQPGIPWWRWGFVAAIWLAALFAVARWIITYAD